MEATSRMLGIDRLLGYPSADVNESSNLSSEGEEEKFEEHFYKTIVGLLLDKETVNGTLLLTPTSIMFDPDQSDPIVSKNGAEKYGIMCNISSVAAITLYSYNQTTCTAGRLLCISLHQAMKRTFSASAENKNEVKQETKKTWFRIDKERSIKDIFTFFVQSAHEDKVDGFSPESNQTSDEISAKRDEICEQFDRLSIEKSSIDIEWQIKRKTSNSISSKASSVTSSINGVADDVIEDITSAFIDDDEDELPEMLGKSNLLTEQHIKKLNCQLPARAVGYPWRLSYSTFEHGMSLKTLYRKMESYAGYDRPVVVVVQDHQSHIFGCYCSCHPHLSEHFQGTGESFLFKLSPNVGFYKWTGENMFFMKGDSDSLTFGSGDGRIGLWLDENLLNGSSRPCQTFNNPVLSCATDFRIAGVEVWSFEF